MIGYTPEPDLYVTKNQPLKIIIVDLWDTPPARILLPENLDERNYDITARIPAADSKLTRTLVREAVEKRFGFRIETETRTVRAYVMTALHPSPQLQLSSPQDGNMTGGGGTSIIGTNRTMQEIAWQFQDLLNTPVVDETGIEGKYNYSALSDLPKPEAIFDFAHQLGLELTPAARPVEILIVRSVVP